MVHPKISDKAPPNPRLLDQVRDKLRVKHYSIRTEQAYTDWIKRYIYFHDKRHPKDTGHGTSRLFSRILLWLVKSLLLPEFSKVIFVVSLPRCWKLIRLDNVQTKAPKRLPVVLTVSECSRCCHI